MAFARRIVVLGCSGSGKSTLAAVLARKLGLPYAPSDHVFWTGDWRPTPPADVRAWADGATAGEAWVLDGNFDSDRDLVWARADLAVWLDLPLGLVMRQVLTRNLGWWLSGARVWGGQRMTLKHAFAGARHALRSHGLKRRAYPAWLEALERTEVVRITSPGERERWLAAYAGGGTGEAGVGDGADA